jgi:predicted ribosome quality control (RQC) complex YloA/Tae2 family protein
MPLDGFMAGYLSRELNDVLTDAKINKIYQPSACDIIFELYVKTTGSARLVLSVAPAYIGFSKLNYTAPKSPSGLCMLFRKHLQNGRIVATRAHHRPDG